MLSHASASELSYFLHMPVLSEHVHSLFITLLQYYYALPAASSGERKDVFLYVMFGHRILSGFIFSNHVSVT